VVEADAAGFFLRGHFAQGGEEAAAGYCAGDLAHLSGLWYQPINDASHIDVGVRHMLEELRSAGTKLAIVSNTFVPPHCLDAHLAQEGLLDFSGAGLLVIGTVSEAASADFSDGAGAAGGAGESGVVHWGLVDCRYCGGEAGGMRTIWKPALHTAPPLFHPRFAFLRRSRRHAPDFTIPRVTELPGVLRHLGWRSSKGRSGGDDSRRALRPRVARRFFTTEPQSSQRTHRDGDGIGRDARGWTRIFLGVAKTKGN